MIKGKIYFFGGLVLLLAVITFLSWLAGPEPIKKINPSIFAFAPADSQMLLSIDLNQTNLSQFDLKPESIRPWFNFLTLELWQEIIILVPRSVVIAKGENFNLIVIRSAGFFDNASGQTSGWSQVGSYWLWSNSQSTLTLAKGLLRSSQASLAGQKDFLKITRLLPASTSSWFYFNDQTFGRPTAAMIENLKSDSLVIKLISLSQDQPINEIKVLLPEFNGSRLVGLNFSEDKKIFDWLAVLSSDRPIPGENFNLSDFIGKFKSEYQLYFDNNDWLAVFKLARDNQLIEETRSLETAWQSYVAKDFPLAQEVVLPDGTKAIYYVKDQSAIKFKSEPFLEQTIYFLSTKENQASLALAVIDNYWLASSKADLIKQLLEARQQPAGLKWWDSLKTRFAPKLNMDRYWRLRLSDTANYANLSPFLAAYQNLELESYTKDGISEVNLKLNK